MEIKQGFYIRIDGGINKFTKDFYGATGTAALMEYNHEGNTMCVPHYECVAQSKEDAQKYLKHVSEVRELRAEQHIALEHFIKSALTVSDGEIYTKLSNDDGLFTCAPIEHAQYILDLAGNT